MNRPTCTYCGQSFVRPSTLDRHQCKAMAKASYFKTAQGKAAFHYYKEWLKLAKHGGNVTEDTFLSSRYFTAFEKFMDYSNKMLLPNKSAFIAYMVSLNILPSSWCNDDIYVKYIENLDITFTPIQQAEETIKTLYELSRIFDCKVDENRYHLSKMLAVHEGMQNTPWHFCIEQTSIKTLSSKMMQSREAGFDRCA